MKGIITGPWTHQEDQDLLVGLEIYKQQKSCVSSKKEYIWRQVQIISNLKRSPKQIRERYVEHLKPGINHNQSTSEEDEIILNFVETHGTKWTLLKNNKFPDRSPNFLKNRFHTLYKQKYDIRFGEEDKISKKPKLRKIKKPKELKHSNTKIPIDKTYGIMLDNKSCERNDIPCDMESKSSDVISERIVIGEPLFATYNFFICDDFFNILN